MKHVKIQCNDAKLRIKYSYANDDSTCYLFVIRCAINITLYEVFVRVVISFAYYITMKLIVFLLKYVLELKR